MIVNGEWELEMSPFISNKVQNQPGDFKIIAICCLIAANYSEKSGVTRKALFFTAPMLKN